MPTSIDRLPESTRAVNRTPSVESRRVDRELPQPAADRRAVAGVVRRAVPGQGLDEADRRLQRAPAPPDRAQRGQRQDRDAVHRAGVPDDRAAVALQRHVGEAHREVPVLAQQPVAGGATSSASSAGRLHEPVLDRAHPPGDLGVLRRQLRGQVVAQAGGQLGRRARCGDQADDDDGRGGSATAGSSWVRGDPPDRGPERAGSRQS